MDPMNVLFEFLSKDPLENYITCLNYAIDKVIYFGDNEAVRSGKEKIKRFLGKYCAGTRPVFIQLSDKDYGSVYDTMRGEIDREISEGNKVYFDVTGGEELSLISFGRISSELSLPTHMYDIPSGRVIELDNGACKDAGITKNIPERKVEYDLATHTEVYGGVIDQRKNKLEKGLDGWERLADIKAIYDVYYDHQEAWTPLANVLQRKKYYVDERTMECRAEAISADLANLNDLDLAEFNTIMRSLASRGVIVYSVVNGTYRIECSYDIIKACLCDGGMILELKTLIDEAQTSDEAAAGQNLDWDGVLLDVGDVYNEIDVVSIKGYVPTFISCKNGRLFKKNATGNRDNGYLHALYELDVVAKRFGGKYVNKVLVTWNEVGGAYRDRADEMGIKIRRPTRWM